MLHWKKQRLLGKLKLVSPDHPGAPICMHRSAYHWINKFSHQEDLWPSASEAELPLATTLWGASCACWACEQLWCVASREAGYQPSHSRDSHSIRFPLFETSLNWVWQLCKRMRKTHINSNCITRYCELGCEATKTWLKAHILMFCTQVMFAMLDCKLHFKYLPSNLCLLWLSVALPFNLFSLIDFFVPFFFFFKQSSTYSNN